MHDEDAIWPKDTPPADADALFELAKEVADEKTRTEINKLELETIAAKKIASSTNGDFGLIDMPETVLDGRLGEVCHQQMLAGNRFPVAYAWPALLTVASALAPRYTENQKLNLYCALVGPLHSGKSQAIEVSQKLLGMQQPILLNIMAGSAEALVRKCKDAVGGARLFSPDELGHLLEKSRIENASFPYILNRAFYDKEFEIHMGRKEVSQFNASLSLIGGLIDNRFEDLFSHATTGGLYDRFIFGACPHGFSFEYYPVEWQQQTFDLKSVFVHEDVWVEKAAWRVEDKELESRTVEIAIRAAIICAAFDGRTILRASDLGPARAFVEYEQRIRRYLKPNDGETTEGKIALKILAYLEKYAGRFVTRRQLYHDISAYRYGPSVVDRTMDILHANGDIVITIKDRPVKVRLIVESENGDCT